MPTIHIPESEVAKNFAAVLAHLRSGTDVAVEENCETVALVTRPTKRPGRMLSEIIALMEAQGSTATVDEDFARDVEAAIEAHREPLDPTAWD